MSASFHEHHLAKNLNPLPPAEKVLEVLGVLFSRQLSFWAFASSTVLDGSPLVAFFHEKWTVAQNPTRLTRPCGEVAAQVLLLGWFCAVSASPAPNKT